jgi:hypothetical protein
MTENKLNKLNKINTQNCFICYEYLEKNNCCPIELNTQGIYITQCKCNDFIHNKCLKLWLDINKNKRCPICRIKVIEKMTIQQYILSKFQKCINVLSCAIVVLSVVLYFYILIDFMFLLKYNSYYYNYN